MNCFISYNYITHQLPTSICELLYIIQLYYTSTLNQQMWTALYHTIILHINSQQQMWTALYHTIILHINSQPVYVNCFISYNYITHQLPTSICELLYIIQLYYTSTPNQYMWTALYHTIILHINSQPVYVNCFISYNYITHQLPTSRCKVLYIIQLYYTSTLNQQMWTALYHTIILHINSQLADVNCFISYNYITHQFSTSRCKVLYIIQLYYTSTPNQYMWTTLYHTIILHINSQPADVNCFISYNYITHQLPTSRCEPLYIIQLYYTSTPN